MKTRSVKTNAILNIVKEIMAILFPMITFPYATRVLGVDNYGKYIFSSSIVNYISYIASAGILRYAVRECASIRDNKKRCEEFVNEIYTINIITTIFAFFILGIVVLLWENLHSYAPIIFTLSLTVLFTTIGVEWINSAFEDYLYITIRYIVCQSVALILLFVLVRTSDDVIPYAAVATLGSVLPNIVNRIHIKKKYRISPHIVISRTISKHFKTIAYFFACTIATYIYINSDITILGIFHDDSISGYYGVSSKFYTIVKQIINAAFVVLIPRISNEISKENIHPSNERFYEILRCIVLLSVPTSVGLVMIRKNLILLFARESYLRAESSLGILAIALIPAMLSNFFVNIIMIPMNQEKKAMKAIILSAIVNLVLNFILIPKYAENAAAFTTLIAEIILFCMGWFSTRIIHFKYIKKEIFISLFGSLGIIIACLITSNRINNTIIEIIVSIILSGVLYVSIILASYKDSLLSMIKQKRER